MAPPLGIPSAGGRTQAVQVRRQAVRVLLQAICKHVIKGTTGSTNVVYSSKGCTKYIIIQK